MTVTIPGTTVEVARNQILAAIQASAVITAPPPNDISPVLVQLDEPAKYDPEDIIWVGDVSTVLARQVMRGDGGAGYLDETYIVEVNITCYRGGDNASLVFARCRALVDAVNAAIRTDPTIGLGQGSSNVPAGAGYVLEAYPERVEWKTSWEENRKGRYAEATIGIHVHAWT